MGVKIGVDGCRGGWAVAHEDKDDLQVRLFSNIHDIFGRWEDISEVWIDMPMGLQSDGFPRTVDVALRELLKPVRHHSVFMPPVRKSVFADGYDEAKVINKEETGKSISIQAWNIVPKIKELDLFLRESPSYRHSIFEAHPELCFKGLNNDRHLTHPKSKQEGVAERLELLSSIDERVEVAYRRAIEECPSTEMKKDDVLDALCLLIASQQGDKRFLVNKPSEDAEGIPMRVVYLAI